MKLDSWSWSERSVKIIFLNFQIIMSVNDWFLIGSIWIEMIPIKDRSGSFFLLSLIEFEHNPLIFEVADHEFVLKFHNLVFSNPVIATIWKRNDCRYNFMHNRHQGPRKPRKIKKSKNKVIFSDDRYNEVRKKRMSL